METVIGLEIHVQLNTDSKAFSSDPVGFGGDPNSRVSPISLAHPGTLPHVNKKQIESAILFGLAIGSRISKITTFDRKNYFYADLPKGYQITQDKQPICVGGAIPIRLGKQTKHIRVHHAHIEEDAGKSIHDQDPTYSLIDLNRAGTPLLEIVTEPDLRSPEEVDALMNTVQQLVRYLEISDGNMEEGSMRCDVNISLRPIGQTTYGQRCEVKNVNSMRFARKAIQSEVKRQKGLINRDISITQQTLNFNPLTGKTTPIRSKETAHDYRYFPEPDLPPVKISQEMLEEQKKKLPALPWENRTLFESWGLSQKDAILLSQDRSTADYYRLFVKEYGRAKAFANLLINGIRPRLGADTLDSYPIPSLHLKEFLDLIASDRLSHSLATKSLFPAMLATPGKRPEVLVQELNLQSNKGDDNQLESLIREIIKSNPDKVQAYQKGKKGLLGFFMGQVMRQTKNKANPKDATALLEKILNKSLDDGSKE